MSILDKANYEKDNYWYRLGNRIAWYDRYQKLWTSYLINEKGIQISDADYAQNKTVFLDLEKLGLLDVAYDNFLTEAKWRKFAFSDGLKISR